MHAPLQSKLDAIARGLLSGRYSFQNESELQEGIASVFASLGWVVVREYRLTDHDRPDFFFEEEGLVVEVKVKGATTQVLRQLSRYAESPKVSAVVLVTSLMRHSVPEGFNGKPLVLVRILSL